MTLLGGYQGKDFAALAGDSMGFGSLVRVSEFGVQRVTNPGDQGFRKEPKLTWAPHHRLVYAVSGSCPAIHSTTPIDAFAVAKKIHARALPYNKGDFGEGYKAYVHVIVMGSPMGEAPRLVRIVTWADETTITEAVAGQFVFGGSARPDAIALGFEALSLPLEPEGAVKVLASFAGHLIERARNQSSPITGVPIIDWPIKVAVITRDDSFDRDFDQE